MWLSVLSWLAFHSWDNLNGVNEADRENLDASDFDSHTSQGLGFLQEVTIPVFVILFLQL